MKTLLRAIVWLALVVWLGGLLFFGVTAWASFSTVADTHVAGTIVSKCLNVLHHEGLVAGVVIVLALAIGYPSRAFRKSTVMLGVVIAVLMIACTVWSQSGIIPRMERDRVAAGGAIDNVPPKDPRHADFDRLHRVSTHIEEAVMLGGVVLVILLARDY